MKILPAIKLKTIEEHKIFIDELWKNNFFYINSSDKNYDIKAFLKHYEIFKCKDLLICYNIDINTISFRTIIPTNIYCFNSMRHFILYCKKSHLIFNYESI